MKTSELLDKVKSGKITHEEVNDVVRLLREGAKVDRYELLYIVGRAGYQGNRSLLEEYLESPDEPMLARIALQSLCSFWGLTSDYRAYLRRFIQGVAWDTDEDVRLVAISAAGEHLRKLPDRELISDLLDAFTDPQGSQIGRETAYLALARGYGLDWDEIPSAAKHFDLAANTDPRVLEWAETQARP